MFDHDVLVAFAAVGAEAARHAHVARAAATRITYRHDFETFFHPVVEYIAKKGAVGLRGEAVLVFRLKHG